LPSAPNICTLHMLERRVVNLFGALAVAVGDRLALDSDSAALVTLDERGDLTIESLRQIIDLSHSASVRLVDRLAATDLVARAAGPDDRSVSVRLTRAGRTVARRLRRERGRNLAEVLEVLDDDERQTLDCIVAKLLAGLTTSRRDARVTCRFCDHAVCAEGGCPVDLAATAVGE